MVSKRELLVNDNFLSQSIVKSYKLIHKFFGVTTSLLNDYYLCYLWFELLDYKNKAPCAPKYVTEDISSSP